VKPSDYQEARKQYAERVRTFNSAHADRERRSSRLGAARLLVFLAFVGTAVAGAAGVLSSFVAIPALVVLGVAFGVMVRVHTRIRQEAERFASLAQVNALADRRARRAWEALPAPPMISVPPEHPYADDLGLFGRASLWQLLPDVSPAPGRRTLVEWLNAPAALELVRERQQAVAELVPAIDLRDDLTAFGMQLQGVPADVVRATVRLPETVSWMSDERWLIPVSRVATAASLAFWIGVIAGALPLSAAGIPIVVLGVIWSMRAGQLRKTFATADALSTALPWYADAIERLASESPASARLQRLHAALHGERHDASHALRSLRRILLRAEVRYSPMLHIPLQVVGLWDFHLAAALERWCRRHGSDIAGWFEALGEIEALAALAGLWHANPEWCMPVLHDAPSSDATRLAARRLGHPLLPPEVMVANDLTIGPPGTFVLVTGSNMSGKSTLLRAAGLNAVLAQAGSAVCAGAFSLPALRVQTSIRIHDSLSDGVSLFMAELQRLRRVVDAAEEAEPAPPVLYLLDEMLQGTNSAERHLAARAVLSRLVRSPAIGLVTTHDVALASAPELTAVAQTVFFDESVQAGTDVPLSFDYRLRQGIVPAGNAMKLLALVGLAEDSRPA
jgi:predicted ATPase